VLISHAVLLTAWLTILVHTSNVPRIRRSLPSAGAQRYTGPYLVTTPFLVVRSTPALST
jgi:hypothetical protein